jgi:hypothetical protein
MRIDPKATVRPAYPSCSASAAETIGGRCRPPRRGRPGTRERAQQPAIVSKHELIEVHLEFGLAHTVIGADEPLLQVASRSIGKRDGRFRALSQFRAKRLYGGFQHATRPASDRRSD